ncbi:fibronectin type III domain-containing protein [Paenibacillus filicis]|uniref:Fibronectin type III domain-containing protein n=1 Tax=Paenibacillus filicis TaxID=669464 RepID=A0ABU9DFD8_9BACL
MLKKTFYLFLVLALYIQTVIISPQNVRAVADSKPPVTTIQVTGGSTGVEGTYFGFTRIQLLAVDDSSGVDYTEYRLGSDSGWTTYVSPVTLRTPGTIELSYRSKDKAGNMETAQSRILVIKEDTVSPETTIQLMGEQGITDYYKSVVKMSFTATDTYSEVDRTEYSLDQGGTWTPFTTAVTLEQSGVYTVLYRSVDMAGNIEKAKAKTIILDLEGPTVPSILLSPGGWTNGNVEVKLADGWDEHSGVQKSQYKIGSQGNWNDYTDPFTVSTTGVKVYARTLDLAGNTSPIAEAQIQIDKTAPTAPLVSLSYEGWINDEVYYLIEDGNDTESKVFKSEFKLNNGAWADYTGPRYVKNEGQTTVYARTVDYAGNISQESSKIIQIDRVKPQAPLIQVPTTEWTNVNIPVTIVHGADALSGPEKSQYKLVANGQWMDYSGTFQINQEGTTTVVARTIDKATNVGPESSVTVKLDKTPPLTPVLKASTTEWTNQNVTVTLTHGIDTLSGVKKSQYRLGNSSTWIDYSNTVTISQEGITSLYARTIDLAGNISTEAVITVKIDKTPPSVPTGLFAPTKTANSVILAWNPSTDNYGAVQYEIYDNATLLGTTDQTRFHALNISPSSTHKFTIKAKDHVDNRSAASNELSITLASPYVNTGRSQFAIKSDGTVWSWGKNSSGELGDGSTAIKSVPTQNTNLSGFRQISSGANHTIGIKGNGTVWAWGSNGNANVPGGSLTSNPLPVQIPNLVSVVSVQAGLAHSLALKEDGTVWGWGSNSFGQLGDGSQTTPVQPVKVRNLDAIVAISTGYYHSMALKSDGSVWTWGSNANGQLGDGTTQDKLSPIQVPGLQAVVAISAGYTHNLALKSDGTVWAWGNSTNGWLGNGASSGQATPVQVSGLTGIKEIAAAYVNNAAVKDDGSVWTWGANSQGFLGDGTTVDRLVPVRVSHLGSIVGISAGDKNILATMSNGSVWTWGSNSDYALGNGDLSISYKTTRIQIKGIPGNYTDTVPPTAPVLSFSGVASNSVILNWTEATDNYTVESYEVYQGTTKVGTLQVDSQPSVNARSYTVTGLSSGTTYSFSVKAKDSSGNYSASSNVVTVKTLAALPTLSEAGMFKSLILKSDGSVWEFGNSNATPTQVSGLYSIINVAYSNSHTLALRSDGTVWAWGTNRAGELGDGSGLQKSTPVQVANLTGVVDISVGNSFSIAVKNDGTVWSWGVNNYGQLGNGDTSSTSKYTPIQVPGLSGIKSVSAGTNHVIAQSTDGRVWTWGENYSGQLGDGTTQMSRSPKYIGSMNSVKSIAAGDTHSMALKNDGTVWVWGGNYDGQLGDNSRTTRLYPVYNPSLNSIVAVTAGGSHSTAQRSDGTVLSWGASTYGQLGNGSNSSKLLPEVMPNFNSVSSSAAGYTHHIAVKTDGSVWGWGANGSYQLGTTQPSYSNVPIKINSISSQSLLRSVEQNVLPNDESLSVEKAVQEIYESASAEYKKIIDLRRSTQIIKDSLSPTAPQNLVLMKQNENGLTLAWDASEDNVGVKQYKIYAWDKLLGTTDGQTTVELDIDPAIYLGLRVIAVDEAGNESLPSNIFLLDKEK